VRPLRIAVVSDWFAPRRGGIEAQLTEICERLGAAGREVDVFTTTPDARDGMAFRVMPAPLELLRLPIQDVVVSPRMLSCLRTELASGYDVVHAHVSVVSPLGYAGVIAARSLGLPVVVTFHSVLRAKAALLRALDGLLDFGGAAVHWSAVSERVAAQVSGALRAAQVSLLSNGVDLPYWAGHSTRVGPSAGAMVTLVSTMRLQRKKRPRQLLRAFAQAVARAGVPCHLILIGDGPGRAAIERDIVALGLVQGRASAEVRGWLDRDSIRSVYAGAHGFVLASRAESFGIAALEARAAGLPVIAMRGGCVEFLTDGADALLCDDDEGLTSALSRFLLDPDLRQRLASASPDLRRYDWPFVLAAHDGAYARAMRLAGRSPESLENRAAAASA